MKRLLYILALLISANSFGQYPTVQNLGGDSTLVNSKGGTKGRFINFVYSDTSAANLDRIRQYPGAQIFTSTGNVVWIRNSTATRWILQSSGAASVTTFSSGNLSPLFTTSVANASTAPALSFAQSNVAANTYFGRLTGIGVPSFIASSDMTIPCSPSATQVSPTQISICLCPAGRCDTLTVVGGINNFYFINDTSLVVCHPPIVICDTIFNADPALPDSIICKKVLDCDTISFGGGGTFSTKGYIFQNGLQQVSPWVIEQGGKFIKNTRITGSNQYSFYYDSLNFTVRGTFGNGQPVDTLFDSQFSFIPAKGALIAGYFKTFGGIGQSYSGVGPFTVNLQVNNRVPGNYSYSSGISNYVPGYVNTVSGEGNQALGNRSFVTGQSNTLNANSYNSAMIGGIGNLAWNHYGLTAGFYNQNYTYAGTVVGVYNDTIHSKARQVLGFNGIYDTQGEGFSVGNGTGVGALRSNSLTLFNGGNLVIGGATYKVGASIDLPNPAKAFAVNRGTTAQMNSVPSPYNGMLYENSDSLALMEYWSALGWVKVDRSGGGGGSGTVTSILSGNGMNFSTITTTGAVTLGTPSSVTLASTNSLTSNSHTHAFAPGGTTAQYITGAGTLVTFPAVSGNNKNAGAGFRWVIAGTDSIKTVFVTSPATIDSTSNSNALTIGLDTAAGKWRSENYYNTVFENKLTFSTGLTRTVNTITGNLSTGIAGSQTAYGGTAANEDLTIQGTVHATKTTSYVAIQPTGGSVSIGATTANASSIFDVTSTTQGVLTPRMTGAQMTAISTPASGLLIYNTDSTAFCYYSGSAWLKIGIGGGGGGVGTVTSVASGNGMNFSTITGSGTVTMGTPSTVTLASTNSTSATSHTHAIDFGGTSSQVVLGNNTLGALPTGTVTSVAMTVPSLLTVSGSPITTSGTFAVTWTGIAQGDLIYGSAANTTTVLNKSITANQFLSNGGASNNPSWASITAAMIGSGAALTKTDDTNVTLTLGGSPTTALLAATSLTLGWTGTLGATRGGTGTGTVAVGDLLYGSGVNTWSKLIIGTSGQVLKVSAGGIPEWGSGGGTGTVTNFIFTDGSGFDGTVTLSTSTPTLALTTTITNTKLMYSNSGALADITGASSNGTGITITSGNLTATRPKFITSIDDTNGNELIIVTPTASAVNEVTLANAATGSSPLWTASGGDANIGIQWLAKGTGTFNFTGNATQAAEIRWYENSGAGSNYISHKAPNLSANVNYVWPVDDGLTNYGLITDGFGNLSWADVGGGGGASNRINALTSAVATNSIDNRGYVQNWAWDSLHSSSGLHLTSTSIHANDDVGLLKVSVSGANASSGKRTVSIYAENTHTGLVSTNVAFTAIASGASQYNIGLISIGDVSIYNEFPTALLHVGSAQYARTGTIGLSGKNSGIVTVTVDSIAGTWTLRLPTNDGNNQQVLTTNGSGVSYWDSPLVSFTLAPIGSTPNANGASFDGTSVFNLQPASASFGGVVTTGTQSFAGVKTFREDAYVSIDMRVGRGAWTGSPIQDNTVLSTDALKNNTTGFSNVGIGYLALAANTTGGQNIAIGKSALEGNTSGSINVAIGTSALKINTIGYGNVAIGGGALQNNTTGFQNTAVGYAALSANTTGFTNTAFGASAMRDMTTGQQNAAFGFNALLVSTTGDKNVAVGNAAMEETTTGYQNAAVGQDAQLHQTTGYGNNALGWLAGSLNVTGYGNVHVGWSSGRNVRNGNENISIGWSSMYLDLASANSQLEGASNSIAIGAYTYTTANNQIVIGNTNHTATYLRGAIFFNGNAGTSGQVLTSQGSASAPIWTTAGAGTVFSVSAGAGMDFTTITGSGAVIMGTPSSVTLASTNSVSGSTHTHAFAPGGTASQVVLGNGTLGTYGGGMTFTDGNGFNGTVTVNDLSLTTTLKTGSVPFIGAGGALLQDTLKFFWDNTSKSLGIGTATVGYHLHVTATEVENYVAYIENLNGNALLVEGDGATIFSVTQNGVGRFAVGDFGAIALNSGDFGLSGQIAMSQGSAATAKWTSTVDILRVNPRLQSTTSSTSLTIQSDLADIYTVTALAANITINAPTGTPVEGQELTLRVKSDATPRTITWNAIFREGTAGPTLPTTTTASKTFYATFRYNVADTKWDVIIVGNGY